MSGTWDGRAYAGAAAHHRAQDEWFLDRHRPAPDARVIDLGGGSGEFTARLAELVPEGSVVGVDPDPSMVAAARRLAAPNLSFVEARARDLDRVVGPGSTDLVVSRAVLHWIERDDHVRCYSAVRSVLRPGGVFHAESAGAGNVERLVALLDGVADSLGSPPAHVTFLTPSTAFELLEEAGFAPGPDGVRTVAQRRPMSRDELLAMVRTQAVHAYAVDDGELRERFVAGATSRLDEVRRLDGSWDQTFVRLEVLVRR